MVAPSDPLGLRSAATLAANCKNSNGGAPALGGFVYPFFGPGLEIPDNLKIRITKTSLCLFAELGSLSVMDRVYMRKIAESVRSVLRLMKVAKKKNQWLQPLIPPMYSFSYLQTLVNNEGFVVLERLHLNLQKVKLSTGILIIPKI